MAASPLSKVYDISGTAGGPVVKDRAWYFVTAHRGGSTTESTNVYYNLNAGDPTKWLYAPDLSRREYSDRLFENASARLTWQITGRNKIGVFWDEQALCRTCTGATSAGIDPPRVSPEAVGVFGRPLRVMQATWSLPLTESAARRDRLRRHLFRLRELRAHSESDTRPDSRRRTVCERVHSQRQHPGIGLSLAGLQHGVQRLLSVERVGVLHHRVAQSEGWLSAHAHAQDVAWMTNNQNLTYRFNNGVPNQLTESISPWVNKSRAGWDAVFAQERWTRGRLTLEGAVRFDRAHSWFPAQQEGPSRFLPTPIILPKTRGVDSYKDVTPRMGAAYDVLGNGRTALKVHLGRYLDGAGTSGIYLNTNPTMRMPQTTPATSTGRRHADLG